MLAKRSDGDLTAQYWIQDMEYLYRKLASCDVIDDSGTTY